MKSLLLRSITLRFEEISRSLIPNNVPILRLQTKAGNWPLRNKATAY